MTWSCKRFSNYVLGSRFEIEMDHKPLVPFWAVSTWTICHWGYSDSDWECPRLITVSATYLGSCFILQMHCLGTGSHAGNHSAGGGGDICQLSHQVSSSIWATTGGVLSSTGAKWRLFTSASGSLPCLLSFAHTLQLCTSWEMCCITPGHHMDIAVCFLHSSNNQSESSAMSHCNNFGTTVREFYNSRLLQIVKCSRALQYGDGWRGMSCFLSQPVLQYSDNLRFIEVWSLAGCGYRFNKLKYLLVVDCFFKYPEVIQLTSTTSSGVIRRV